MLAPTTTEANVIRSWVNNLIHGSKAKDEDR